MTALDGGLQSRNDLREQENRCWQQSTELVGLQRRSTELASLRWWLTDASWFAASCNLGEAKEGEEKGATELEEGAESWRRELRAVVRH